MKQDEINRRLVGIDAWAGGGPYVAGFCGLYEVTVIRDGRAYMILERGEAIYLTDEPKYKLALDVFLLGKAELERGIKTGK